MKHSPHSPQLEKACVQQQRPNAAKKKKDCSSNTPHARILREPQVGVYWAEELQADHNYDFTENWDDSLPTSAVYLFLLGNIKI